MELKVEIIDQYVYDDHALAYLFEAENVVDWASGHSTQLQTGYLFC